MQCCANRRFAFEALHEVSVTSMLWQDRFRAAAPDAAVNADAIDRVRLSRPTAAQILELVCVEVHGYRLHIGRIIQTADRSEQRRAPAAPTPRVLRRSNDHPGIRARARSRAAQAPRESTRFP